MAKIIIASCLPTQRFLIVLNILFLCYLTNAFNDNNSQSRKVDYMTSNSTSKRCQQSYTNLTQQELARFLDASGKPGSGIYGGNTMWYGSYSECQKLSDSRYCLAVFPGIVFIGGQGEMHNIEWGVCMPDVCTEEDVSINFEFLFNNVSHIQGVQPFNAYFLMVKCAKDPEYSASVVITIIFCGLLVGLCLLATIVDILSAPKKSYNETETVENGGHISMDKDAGENTPLLLPDTTTSKDKKNEGLFSQTLHSFSMIRNTKTIMNTNVGNKDLRYLHGIRVLSLFWIALIHGPFIAILNFWPYNNVLDVIQLFTRRLASLVLNTAYGVDTFFLLSGLLVMYTNMSKKVNNNGKTNWFKYYFHRFWRLTPTLMFCILLRAKLVQFFGAGPVWFAEADSSSTCSDHWWTNLLYLNNFLKIGKYGRELCLGHTWYLAADMQMFILSPIFLIIAYRYKFRSLICIVGVTILASIIVTACLAADDDVVPLTYPFIKINSFFKDYQNEVFSREVYDKWFRDIYVKPYCRISPYVMGMVLGYVLFKHFSKEFKLPLKYVAVMWTFAISLALTVVYAPHTSLKEDPHVWTTGEKAAFWALKWPIWGLCVSWLIFACHYNYAGLVKNILEAKFWIPLSRINYAAFIIHFDVIQVLVLNIETPIHFTAFTLVTYYLSALVLAYAIAFIITVVVELPCANLEAIAWRKWEKKK